MTLNRRQVLLLLPAAAVAWEFALAGNPEAAPNYTMTEHWWGMLLDISKCIGCGSCVQACQETHKQPAHEARALDEQTYTFLMDRGNPRN